MVAAGYAVYGVSTLLVLASAGGAALYQVEHKFSQNVLSYCMRAVLFFYEYFIKLWCNKRAVNNVDSLSIYSYLVVFNFIL